MAFFGNKRKDFSIQPPKLQVDTTPFYVTDSANIDFTFANLNLTADLIPTGVLAGTYGDATHIPILQIDQWGRVTGVTTTTFSASGILLQTDGVDNGSQTILNLVEGTDIKISDDGLGNITFEYVGTSGSGTVTSVSAGTGMNFTTITGSGSVSIDTTKVPYLAAGFSTGLLKWDGSAWVFDNSAYLTTAVTSVGTGTGLTGGTITGAGTVSLNSKLAPADNLTGNALKYLRVNAGETAVEYATASSSGGILHGTTSGTDTYTVTIVGATAYADGDAYLIRFAIGNTTSATLNINGQGAIPLYRNNDGPLLGGDVIAGGEMVCVYNSTLNIFQCIGISPNSLIAYVTNDDSVTITKGQPVYAFSGTGDRMTVKLAYNTGDSTSAQTVGLVLSTSIAANQKGLIMMQGLLDGLSNVKPVNGWADGSPVYLGTTAGSITPTKQYAPNHLVYLGFVTTASPGSAGRIYVRVQNGFELDELHNVQAQTPANNDTLYYDNVTTPLKPQWKTASIATILGYTPVPTTRAINTTAPLTGGGDLSADRTLAIPQATSSVDGYLSSSDWSVFNNKALNYKNTVDTAGYSGNTNTVVYTQLISANIFTNGDIIRVTYRTKKTGGNGNQTLRIYVNATADLLGTPVLLGGFNSAGANLFTVNQMLRHLVIKSSTSNTEVYLAAGTATPSDYSLYNGVTNASINWTLNRYFVFTIQSTSLTDVNFGSMYLIEKL